MIVGGGHNGLTAAAYLARAGLDVLLLERDDHLGGAAISAPAFEGVEARLSRYSYLVSLLPKRIIDDLGLDLRLVRRAHSSYTPDPHDPTRGLLIERDGAGYGAFERIGAASDALAWGSFGDDTVRLAEAIFPTLTEPLPTRDEVRRMVDDARVWDEFVRRPLGEAVAARFSNDLVRGVVETDGLIGTFTRTSDPALDANRCFLYHVIGGGTGDWDVPVGGMGAVSGELARAARTAGATLVTGADVTSITPDGEVRYTRGGVEHTVSATTVLSGVAPHVLARLLGEPDSAPRPEGAQLKVNLLLTRLPRLRDTSVSPEAAFGGTLHVNETASQLEAAYAAASAGRLPDPMPCEVYCHTLSDPSILSPSSPRRARTRSPSSPCTCPTAWSTRSATTSCAAPPSGRCSTRSTPCSPSRSSRCWRRMPRAGRASRRRRRATSSAPSRCPAATSSTGRCRGRGARRATPPRRRPSAGAWPRRTRASSCAGRARCAGARCRASAGTTPPWPWWSRSPRRRRAARAR
ncbi:hypothetical protein GCM10025877_17930 [Agromyces mangrovi Wang et al. 2018]|nr:hypothetical protein GCM10025877_17930 [Agromyces mangrovi]